MLVKKIFIDPGHGGKDPGAVGNGLKEKDLTLAISERIERYLDDNYTGHTTILSRTGDTTLSLKQRTDYANSWGADFLISVHINAGGGTGYEDFIYHKLSNFSKTAMKRDLIHFEIVKALGDVMDRGKKKANFHMIRESKMSAVLTENLFIDTKADADKLKSAAYLDKIAKGHALGIAKALRLEKKVVPTPSKPKNDIDGHWAEEYLKIAKEKGVIEGFPDGTMRPDDPLTRGQAAKIIVELGLLD